MPILKLLFCIVVAVLILPTLPVVFSLFVAFLATFLGLGLSMAAVFLSLGTHFNIPDYRGRSSDQIMGEHPILGFLLGAVFGPDRPDVDFSVSAVSQPRPLFLLWSLDLVPVARRA